MPSEEFLIAYAAIAGTIPLLNLAYQVAAALCV